MKLWAVSGIVYFQICVNGMILIEWHFWHLWYSQHQHVKREKTNKMQQSNVYYQLLSRHVLGIIMPVFRRTKTVVTACGVLRWFCWMWLVAVVGHCVVSASYNAAPHNRYQPHPAEPAQHTTCSNTWFLFS